MIAQQEIKPVCKAQEKLIKEKPKSAALLLLLLFFFKDKAFGALAS